MHIKCVSVCVGLGVTSAYMYDLYTALKLYSSKHIKSILTPVSAIKGLPYLLHQGEVLSLRDHIINGFYDQFWV